MRTKINIRSTFAVLFYIDKSKITKQGVCVITGRISVDAQSARFSTKQYIEPDRWDSKSGRAVGKSKESISLNRILDKLETEIEQLYNRLALEDGYVTAERIKNALMGLNRKAVGVLELFREHNEEFKLRVGVNRTQVTYEQYLHSYRVLENFIKLRYQKKDIPLTQLNHPFIDAYDFHLRVDKRMNGNTVLNHIIPLRKMVRRAISQDIIKRDPFANYVAEKPPKQRRHLTMEEFQKLLTTPISEKHLERCRDMFLFAAFTCKF